MAEIDNFLATPTLEVFEEFTKEQLVLLAGHYGVSLSSSAKRNKGVMQTIIRETLVEKEVLPAEPEPPPELPPIGLSFEQQKELLQLQIDKGKLQLLEREALVEKCRLERDIEVGKQEFEREKMALEHKRLALIEEGKSTPITPINGGNIDVTRYLRLLPKFEESNVDTFFTLFERVADLHDWSDATQCLLLQFVLSGRAAQAYAARCVSG